MYNFQAFQLFVLGSEQEMENSSALLLMKVPNGEHLRRSS